MDPLEEARCSFFTASLYTGLQSESISRDLLSFGAQDSGGEKMGTPAPALTEDSPCLAGQSSRGMDRSGHQS